MVVGVDFGLSVTDAVAITDGEVSAHAALSRPGPASLAVLDRALAALITRLPPGSSLAGPVGITGGRSRELPERHQGLRLSQVGEPEALARGALALAGVGRALVVSCGTGTAMVAGDAAAGTFDHVTGTPVGGGTLQAFGRLLFDGRDADAVAAMAMAGDAGKVDTTLADVLGGSLGGLPASATAVSLGRLGALEGPLASRPAAADLAAGLCTMVAQTIAIIAVNAARAIGSPSVVFVGRLARYEMIASMIRAVFTVYRYPLPPLFPDGSEQATALGAALAVEAGLGRTTAGPADRVGRDAPSS